MKSVIKLALITSALLFANPSSADFVKKDFQEEGDQLILLDTDTGIGWLNLNVTKNLSYYEVLALLETDAYAGFRQALRSDVDLMIDSLFDGAVNTARTFNSFEGSELVDTYADAFTDGQSYKYDANLETLGGVTAIEIVTQYDSEYAYSYYAQYNVKDESGYFFASDNYTYADNNQNKNIDDDDLGYFLIYDDLSSVNISAVNTPGHAALGLLALLALTRRKSLKNKSK
jgi:hypothetical protein